MKRRARALLFFLLLAAAMLSTGCIQEALVIPVATVKGKVVVPAGQTPLGIRVTVAGNPNVKSYVNEKGEYKLEFTRAGRYLLVARGANFDVDFIWVDAILEETVTASDISLSEKITGEAKWIATTVDFPGATNFKIKSINPKWATDTVAMTDDGSGGDKYAGDGIYTLRLRNLPTGSQLYTLLYTGKAPEDSDDEDKDEIKERDAKKDPHHENERIGNSEIIVPEPAMKLARGYVSSSLTGVNYSEVVLGTKMGARKMNVNSDGYFSIPMEGNGREYLAFRSPSFHIRVIPVDLSTTPIYEVPTVTLSAKAAGEATFMLIKSDFQTVTNPTVVADFTNWQPQSLYDDGTHGDATAGDGVYTLVKTGVAPGYHKYAFNVTATSQVRDPYEESGDSQYSILLVK
ncbi:MAG TPA: carboxypeptidase-like regulatory domain-containing protein [Candidatus Ozemobacteraceae bacterium]|nr:carboxypeptidase-like regulatory domain-containing protein [Candidatus Ozemobacteraceae bacterium]